MVNVFGLVIGFGVAVGILWLVNKFILKKEEGILSMVWAIALVLIVVGIAGFVVGKIGVHGAPKVAV